LPPGNAEITLGYAATIGRSTPTTRGTSEIMSSQPTIQLLYFAGCPHAAAARALLTSCLERLGVDWPVEEKDGDYPSPTILIDGIDVMGKPPAAHRMCRLDVPTEARLMSALAKCKDST
jgi:hypothetical protein